MVTSVNMFCFSFKKPRPFNLTRFIVYFSVICFTVICLGVAGHLAHVLANSDLTRFVPFTLFVCCASIAIFSTLLGFSMLGTRNPINTKIELACLSAAGVIWLVLAVFLSTSPSQDADVECFASSSSSQALDESLASFKTETYQAMYRVIMAFALINASVVLAASFLLAFLAIRSFTAGNEHYLMTPVTTIAWFTSPKAKGTGGILGRDVSHKRSRGNSRSHRPPYQPSPYTSYEKRRPGSAEASLIEPRPGAEEIRKGAILNPNLPTYARYHR